jgi:hypothetical protein
MCERVLLPWHAVFQLPFESTEARVELPVAAAPLPPPAAVAPAPAAPAAPAAPVAPPLPEALPLGTWSAAQYAWDPHTLVRAAAAEQMRNGAAWARVDSPRPCCPHPQLAAKLAPSAVDEDAVLLPRLPEPALAVGALAPSGGRVRHARVVRE